MLVLFDSVTGQKKKYFLLSDSLEEDKQIREYLQRKRLQEILETQQKERTDPSFSRLCLFCSHNFEGNRASLIDHMAFDHNFSIGKPDDIGELQACKFDENQRIDSCFDSRNIRL